MRKREEEWFIRPIFSDEEKEEEVVVEKMSGAGWESLFFSNRVSQK